MRNKVLLGVIAGLIILFGILTIDYFKKQKSVEDILFDAYDKFEIQSVQVGEDFPDIYIDVYDIDDAPKIKKYIKRKLSAEDREKYNIEIFSLEETQKLKPLQNKD